MCRSLIFSKTTADPIFSFKKNTPRQVFSHFAMISMTAHHKQFNFVMHLDQQQRNSTTTWHFQHKTKKNTDVLN